MPLLFIDTETGGLDPRRHSLLAVGYVLYDPEKDEVLEEGELYVRSETYNVTAGALEVNKLDLREVYDKGRSPQGIINYFKKLAEEYGRLIIAGWNVQFDMAFLREFYRDHLAMDDFEATFYYKPIDVCSMLYLFEGRMYRLQEAVEKFIPQVGENSKFHTAHYDAKMTLEIFRFLRKRLEGVTLE